MKVAIVYDRVNKFGGAERVLLALHEIFPQADLFTSVYDSKGAGWAKVFPHIYTSFFQKISFLRNKHELLGTFMPLVFESFNFSKYDLVISVTSEAAKGIITNTKTKHVCYLLTPTRYLWSGYDLYFNNKFVKYLSYPIIKYLRSWDKVAANRPDKLISISSEVRNRTKKYYKLDSDIIFPPVNVDKFSQSTTKKDYYLMVGRLIPYKKFDLAIKVFNKLGKKLIIIGTGSEERKLKNMAKNNIKFIGKVSDKKLANYYQKAKGFIFPQEEDFGIVVLEAQAAGTPVIAYKKGGAMDTVIDRKTGVFFLHQTEQSLTEAILRFEKLSFKRDDLIRNAKKFSKKVFFENISKYIKNL